MDTAIIKNAQNFTKILPLTSSICLFFFELISRSLASEK
ncbi:hypothetical protein CGLO_11893 [Colletotrichum gloeosporioides Cg-14]|uniref:Uncharacterized protein n=1 Tax=Colletotrichum gloeosporioides (strain Cg-14) TaxID=1237896 RepID=T0K793_COLGC|nr:hypothetical protein CGLO_11893 [Colletotrichum gloeosporioides Cg-14]